MPTLLRHYKGMKSKRRKNRPIKVEVGNATVRIYIHKRSDRATDYQVADYSTGTRCLRTCATIEAAKAEADKIARLMSSGDVQAAMMRNSEAASYGRAIQLLKPTGTSLELAAAGFAKAFEILGRDRVIEAATFFEKHNPEKLPQKTVQDVVSELIAHRKTNGASEVYIIDLQSRLSRFATDFQCQVSSVIGADVGKWLDGLPLSPRSKNNFRTNIRTLFSFSERQGYILKGSNPAAETDRFAEKGGTVEIYSPTELAKLLQSADQNFMPCLAIGAFAGCRTAEILRMEWRDIDLSGGFITVSPEKSKTKERRIIPILPVLSNWLSRVDDKDGLLWRGTKEAFFVAQKSIASAAKVTWKSNALRHSFASYRLADVQNAAQVSLEMGNSPQMVFKHYRELVKPAAAKEWFSIFPKSESNIIQRNFH